MSACVFLHVGTPKSGTTYLQDLMWANGGALAEAGICYPGDGPAAHFHAAVELAYGNFHGWTDPGVEGAWTRLVREARAHQGTTVISHELFGDLSAAAAAQALAGLDFAEVHVIVTARDLARQLPAVWQEDVKNRHFLPYEQFLDVVRPGAERDVHRPGPGRPEGHSAAFWLRQDVPAVLRRWAAVLPSSRVHLVTVPGAGRGPEVLWQRFAEVISIEPVIVTPLSDRRNASLGSAGTELLRRLNQRLDYSVAWPVYGPLVARHLAPTTLTRRESDPPLRLPAAERAWVSAWTDQAVSQLRDLRCPVVGDLEELRSPAVDEHVVPAPPSAEELLELALDALAALMPAGPPVAEAAPVPAAPAELEAELRAGPQAELEVQPAPERENGPDPAPEPEAQVEPVPWPSRVQAVLERPRRGWRFALRPDRLLAAADRADEELAGVASTAL